VSRRLIILGFAAASLAGAAVPAALASTDSPVTVDTSNGVRVGVHNGNTPIAGASVTPDGQACVGISLQLPVCTPGGIIGGISATVPQTTGQTRQTVPTPPVVVRHDDNGTAVGVGDVGVLVEKDGSVCPVVSTQNWRCIHTG
jgi:hypothetical protein